MKNSFLWIPNTSFNSIAFGERINLLNFRFIKDSDCCSGDILNTYSCNKHGFFVSDENNDGIVHSVESWKYVIYNNENLINKSFHAVNKIICNSLIKYDGDDENGSFFSKEFGAMVWFENGYCDSICMLTNQKQF